MQARHIPTYREPPTLRSLPIRSSVPFQLRERRVLLPQRLERPHRARERREPAPAHYERPDQRRRSSGEKSAETAPTHNLPGAVFLREIGNNLTGRVGEVCSPAVIKHMQTVNIGLY